MFSSELLISNLLSPVVLAFALGMFARAVRSDLEIPAAIQSYLSIFLLLAIGLGERATAWAWTLFCVSSSVLSLSQPAVGQASPSEQAGRALSAYNLVIFGGIFTLQWGLGIAIDTFMRGGGSTLSAFRAAMALFAACAICAYLWFLRYDDASVGALPVERA